MILISEIIARYEKMKWNRWPERPTGGRSIRNDEIEYRKNRREELLADIRLLEAEGLVCMKRGDWVEPGRDPARIPYRLEDMERFYELAGLTPKWERLENQKTELQAVRAQIKTSWILNWLDDEAEKLTAGKLLKEEELPAARKLWSCMAGLDLLEHLAEENSGQVPMLQRGFSKRFLGNSKTFEKELRGKVCDLARRYRQDIPKDREQMDDVEVLKYLYIEVYSQELTLKGSLRFSFPAAAGKEHLLDTADYPYGLVLNQQTLTHLRLCGEQSIRLVRTIENKANFVAEPYEAGKLVIFTHGYLTPGERTFLRSLKEILDCQPEPVRYEHSGDMDFGGISIYRYLREQVFPELTPYRMDVAAYEECAAKGMTEDIPEAMAEKLRKLTDDPQLGELAARLAADRKVVEQEAYL